MAPSTRTLVVGTVAVLTPLLIVYEELLVFAETTGTLPPGIRESPLVLAGIPFGIGVALVVVLLGAAIHNAETLR